METIQDIIAELRAHRTNHGHSVSATVADWANRLETAARAAPDESERAFEDAYARAQVGEVQVDAHDFGAMTDLLGRWQRNAAITPSPNPVAKARREVWAQCLSELQAALAARQPVAKADEAAILRHGAAVLDMWEGDPNDTGYMGDFKDACAILEVLALHAAPPAHGIDLRQLRELAESWKVVSDQDPTPIMQAHQHANHCCADELLALIDQRDAAPGTV